MNRLLAIIIFSLMAAAMLLPGGAAHGEPGGDNPPFFANSPVELWEDVSADGVFGNNGDVLLVDTLTDSCGHWEIPIPGPAHGGNLGVELEPNSEGSGFGSQSVVFGDLILDGQYYNNVPVKLWHDGKIYGQPNGIYGDGGDGPPVVEAITGEKRGPGGMIVGGGDYELPAPAFDRHHGTILYLDEVAQPNQVLSGFVWLEGTEGGSRPSDCPTPTLVP